MNVEWQFIFVPSFRTPDPNHDVFPLLSWTVGFGRNRYATVDLRTQQSQT